MSNPAAESALDLSRKSLEGQSVHDLFGDNQALNGMINDIKQGHVMAQRQRGWCCTHRPGSIHQDSIPAHCSNWGFRRSRFDHDGMVSN
jgi:two-component system nitrogen regulation sensor histidine kinase GlnL